MKNTKSLTLLILAMLVSACTGNSSAAFSSSNGDSPSSSSSSSNKTYERCYDGYYDSLVSWTNGEDLKNQLNAIIRNGYTPISYAGKAVNWQTNVAADHSKNDFEYLDVVYKSTDVYKGETNKGWQREHAFCASLMCGSLTASAVNQKGRATDFHNLFASDASANGSRGQKYYGYADKTAANYTNRTTDNGYDGYSYSSNFEPGNKDKGRLARAIFYMATMYKDDEEDFANNITMKGLRIVEETPTYIAGENGNFVHGNLSALLQWNNSFNVDYLEMQHNVAVYTSTDNPDGVAQGNRNPYVDYPELVDYVYGSKKNSAGSLKNLTPSCVALNSESSEISHYAIKEAKREYSLGETVSSEDYKVVAVKNNYSYNFVTEGITHSLSGHAFDDNDGDYKDATITTPNNTLQYRISLNPMALCSTGQIVLSADGINKRQKNTDQEVSFGNYNLVINYSTPFDNTNTNYTINNIWSNGSGSEVLGVTFGSKDRSLTKLTIKTKESYTIDGAYVKAFLGNADSSYSLKIFVGDTFILPETTVNNKDVGKVYGKKTSPVTGQLTYVFEGSSSLKINSIAFNVIIA